MAERVEEQRLFDWKTPTRPQGPVECLGMTFENDEARREYFLGLLREGLEELHAKLGGVPFTTMEDAVQRMKSIQKWPMGEDTRLRDLAERMREAHRKEPDKDLLQLWKDQIGFPHGSIEDILNLSDPPYYTACPNPWIGDFIAFWEAEKRRHGDAEIQRHGDAENVPASPHPRVSDSYHREPFAADVSEGKNDPIYNAHSYHTKVPHKAIMHYILHYTEPGDIVFDGFAGTGMTGVAAQLCGDRKAVEALGYKVDSQGIIYRREKEIDETGKTKTVWKPFSKLGPRYAILNDLSPAATFIAYNYNTPVNVQEFEREAKRILKEVEEECGWMYTTLHNPQKGEPEVWAEKLRACKTSDEVRELVRTIPHQGRINYTVWSDVFVCPECTQEVVFWEAAVDKEAGKVHSEFPCPHCGAMLTKRNMDRAWVTRFDPYIDTGKGRRGATVRQAKQVPVLINYSVGKRRYEKRPDAFDLALIEKIEQLDIPYWFPTDPIPKGEKTGEPLRIGITHVHHFYTKRNLWVVGAYCIRANKRGLFLPSSLAVHINKMRRYQPVKQGGTPGLPGTLYISAISVELPFFDGAPRKHRDIKKALENLVIKNNCITTQSASTLYVPDNSINYIFTDPPFGGNLMYSELNFLWEAWLKVFTNNVPEAITNETQGKGLPEYQRLMTECFREYFRVLKPGRWMTVVFHNSKNSIWNAIQEALQTAGFVVADVRTLDKKQGSFNQVTQAGAVKQDIIISCYKPNSGLEERFKLEAGTEEGVWDFVRTHLKQLPVVVENNGRLEVIAERQAYLLYDRMVAFHVQRGVTVPLSAAEFYAGLAQRFPERDGMYFLPEQVAEYDKRRMQAKELQQLTLFVTDETSAIQWLRQQLSRKPQTFQELHPKFLKEISGWQKHEKPLELSELLEQNFLRYEGKGPIPSQIVSWMKQSSELRKVIQEELASGRATEENGQLSTQSPVLIARAKDRWYVPDPNKQADLEKLRERALLREFEEYKQFKGRRLRVFRLEAIRAGFKKAWQERDYQTIIAVAHKIPENVLQEDPKLLMWYDQAVTRTEEQ